MSILSRLFNNPVTLDLTGFTDWHCHLLPGVDDGVKTMQESLEILDRYESLGISEVWLTPHIMEDIPNTTEALQARFQELRNVYKGNIQLHLASENMLDNLFLERLEANDLLCSGHDGKTLLVETSYFNPPIRMREMIDAIKDKGYIPLLAHPERYNYITSMTEYRRIYDMGVKLQVNLMSLCGYYGNAPQEKAWGLLSEGMVDRFGSDLHRREHLKVMANIRIGKNRITRVQGILAKDISDNINDQPRRL